MSGSSRHKSTRPSEEDRDVDVPPSAPSSASASKGERRSRRRRVRRKEKFLKKHAARFFGISTAVGLLVAATLGYLFVVFPAGAGPGPGRDAELTIEPTDDNGAVVAKLERAGLLRSPRTFSIYVALVRPRFAPGQHLLTDEASPHELIRRLERLGAAQKARVTIPEGWNRFDIAKRLHTLHVTTAASFLRATSDPELVRGLGLDGESVEGYLFPATYDLPKDSDPRDVVRRLVAEFERRYAFLEQNHRLGGAQLQASLGWGRRQIVTLASMIEKEAAVDDERPLIASVFLNRLRDPAFKRKVLQCDPTSGYGCLVMRDKIPACASYTGKITPAINNDPANVYSTYVHEGLPPGPIANPGIRSMQAVLASASTKFLYFVTRGDRRHAFSATLEEHNAAVKELRERSHKPE